MYNVSRTDPAYSYFDDGFETGKNWTETYRPGGPYCDFNNAEDVANRATWFKGFDKGLEEF